VIRLRLVLLLQIVPQIGSQRALIGRVAGSPQNGDGHFEEIGIVGGLHDLVPVKARKVLAKIALLIAALFFRLTSVA